MRIRPIYLCTALALAASAPLACSAESESADVKAQATRQHDEAIKRLQDWIGQVSIAAEDRGYPEGADYMIKLLKDAGFQRAERVDTDGKPGVFATLDAGTSRSGRSLLGIPFYLVKRAARAAGGALVAAIAGNGTRAIERVIDLAFAAGYAARRWGLACSRPAAGGGR